MRYVGWVGRKELGQLLAGVWSLWLPSLWAEPFGIAGLEALALGVPVTASHVGGVGEWLQHGVSWFLLPAGDARAGAGRMARDDKDPTFMARLRECYWESAGRG